MFGRQELIRIRECALQSAMVEGLNPNWKRALLQLADAANHLDAMIARTQVRTDKE